MNPCIYLRNQVFTGLFLFGYSLSGNHLKTRDRKVQMSNYTQENTEIARKNK